MASNSLFRDEGQEFLSCDGRMHYTYHDSKLKIRWFTKGKNRRKMGEETIQFVVNKTEFVGLHMAGNTLTITSQTYVAISPYDIKGFVMKTEQLAGCDVKVRFILFGSTY